MTGLSQEVRQNELPRMEGRWRVQVADARKDQEELGPLKRINLSKEGNVILMIPKVLQQKFLFCFILVNVV